MATKNLRFILEMYANVYSECIINSLPHSHILHRNQLCSKPIPNVYASPSFDDIKLWNGVIFPDIGYYKGGIFRFRLLFGDEFPSKAPKIYFETDIFHPLIDPITKELSLRAEHDHNTLHVADILAFIRNALIDDIKYWHNALLIFNRDCFKSYIDYLSQKQSKNHAFIQRISECVELSVSNKDKQIDIYSNPLVLGCTDTDGHARIIKENLKTFKVSKSIFYSFLCKVIA